MVGTSLYILPSVVSLVVIFLIDTLRSEPSVDISSAGTIADPDQNLFLAALNAIIWFITLSLIDFRLSYFVVEYSYQR